MNHMKDWMVKLLLAVCMLGGAGQAGAAQQYTVTIDTATLGGVLSFDVGFTLGAGDAGTTFGWSLFNDAGYLGADGDLGTVSLQPGAAPGAIFAVNNASPLSHVQAVPEPSSVVMMLAGMLCLMAHARRRR